MPSQEFEPKEFYAELEAAGVEEVRNRIASGTYSVRVGEKGALAQEWVRRKDQEWWLVRQARQDAATTRAVEDASRAADAAERAAKAAERQATTAKKGTRIARAALVVAIVAALLSLIAMARGI